MINVDERLMKCFLFAQIHKNEGEEFSDTSIIDKYTVPFIKSCQELLLLQEDMDEETVKFRVYEIGKSYYGEKELRTWFSHLYLLLLKEEKGPRLPTFIMLIGINNFKDKISQRLSNPFLGW